MTSSKKGFDSIRKFGTCMGSNICMNPKYPPFTREGIRNEIDFKKGDCGGYICSSCGYLVTRKFCGCIKVTQFDHQNNLMAVWHQGKHSCSLKPNTLAESEKLKGESKKRPPFSIQLRSTTREFQINLIGYCNAIGDQKRAIEIKQVVIDHWCL